MHGAPYFNQIVVPIPGRSMHVRIAGSGCPILFLHGYPLDSRMWERVVSLLADRYLCVAPDLRGFGRNAEESRSFSMTDLADDCMHMIRGIQVRQPVIVCGLSMGGYVAMQLVERHAQSVAKVLLTNTRCNADDAAGAEARRLAAQAALRDGVSAAVSPMLEKLICSKTSREQPDVENLVRIMMSETRASTIAWVQLAMSSRIDFGMKMRSWTLPALCIGGDLDPITPPMVLEQMASRIPHARCEIIADSAHLTPLEQPGRFANLVDAFATSTPNR